MNFLKFLFNIFERFIIILELLLIFPPLLLKDPYFLLQLIDFFIICSLFTPVFVLF
jgi:hypothetical protein